MAKRRRVTLEDVARRVGCSKSAVSYAILRNHPLSGELKERIWKAIEELGYRPYGVHARPEKRAVALLTDHTTPAIEELFRQALQEKGLIMQQYLLPTRIPFASFGKELGIFLNNDPNLAGIISLHPDIDSFDLIKRCKNVPSVIYYREGSMCSRVIVRMQEIGQLAARYLCRLNHRKAAFLEFRKSESPYIGRIFGALAAELNATRPEVGLEKIELEEAAGLFNQLDLLFAAGTGVFFAHSVAAAIPILQWAYAAGQRIPEELSLFCIDYSEEAALLSPPLTSISLPHRQMVAYTVDELLAQLKCDPVAERELAPFLVDRGSAVPVENRLT